MTILIHRDSHVDHNVGCLLDEGVLDLFSGRTGLFVVSIDMATTDRWKGVRVPVGLVGPANGDPPVAEDEVEYRARGGRAYPSRMLRRGTKGGYVRWRNTHTSVFTVVAGPHDGHPCVLYTAYGGPAAPKEPGDPTLKPEEREASAAFWKEHALVEV